MGTFNASVMHDAQSWSEGIKRYKEEKTSHFFGGVVEKPVRVKHFFKKREECTVNPILQTYTDPKAEFQLKAMERNHNQRTLNQAYDKQVALEQKFDIITQQPKVGHVWEVEYHQKLKPPSLVTVSHAPYDILSTLTFDEHHWAPPGKRPPRMMTAPRKEPFLTAVNKPREFDITSNYYKRFHKERMQFEAQERRAEILDKFAKTRVYDPIKVRYYDEQKETQYQQDQTKALLARGKNHMLKYPPTYQTNPSNVYDIVSLEPRDDEKFRSLQEQEQRVADTKAAMAVGRAQALKALQEVHDNAEIQRKMNRISHSKYEALLARGYDILSNADFDKIGTPPQPHTKAKPTLHTHFLSASSTQGQFQAKDAFATRGTKIDNSPRNPASPNTTTKGAHAANASPQDAPEPDTPRPPRPGVDLLVVESPEKQRHEDGARPPTSDAVPHGMHHKSHPGSAGASRPGARGPSCRGSTSRSAQGKRTATSGEATGGEPPLTRLGMLSPQSMAHARSSWDRTSRTRADDGKSGQNNEAIVSPTLAMTVYDHVSTNRPPVNWPAPEVTEGNGLFNPRPSKSTTARSSIAARQSQPSQRRAPTNQLGHSALPHPPRDRGDAGGGVQADRGIPSPYAVRVSQGGGRLGEGGPVAPFKGPYKFVYDSNGPQQVPPPVQGSLAQARIRTGGFGRPAP